MTSELVARPDRQGASPEPPAPTRTATSRPGLLVLVLVVLLIPFVISGSELFAPGGSRFGSETDNAVNELHVRDLGEHPVLLGPYSRDGWSHPGPLLYYVLALPYWAAGQRSVGMALGAIAINVAAIAGILLIARRFGGRSLLLLSAFGLGLLMRELGAEWLRDPRNLSIVVLPFALLISLGWAMTCGARWAFPVAVAVGSFCVQTHVGYAGLVVPLLLAGAVALLVADRRRPEVSRPARRPAWWWLAAGVLIGVILWLPTVVEAIAHSGGNVGRLWDYSRDPPRAVHSIGVGYLAIAEAFGLRLPWFVARDHSIFCGFRPRADLQALAPMALAALGTAVAVFGTPRARRYLFVAALTAGFAVLSVARTPGPLWRYRLDWIPVVGMVASVAVAWGCWTVLAARFPAPAARFRGLATVGAVAAVVTVGLLASAQAAGVGDPIMKGSGSTTALVESLRKSIGRTRGQVILRSADYGGTSQIPSLALGLEKAGLDPRVPLSRAQRVSVAAYDDSVLVYGRHRICRRDEPIAAELDVASAVNAVRLRGLHPGAVLAWSGPWPPRPNPYAIGVFRHARSPGADTAPSDCVS